MIERQFFIYPLSEDEIKNLNNRPTGSIATEDQQPPIAQIQPERNTVTERRIFTIYEAPKIEVATQQNQALETTPTIPTPEQMPLYPQPEIHEAKTTQTNEYYSAILKHAYGEQKSYSELLSPFHGEKSYSELLSPFYGEQQTEQDQIALIRSELAELTPAAGAPAPQTGELAQAA
jgi:hypothetical protein